MNEAPKYEIFISYRRAGGVDYARMIYLELKGRGYNTFFDFNSLRSGKFNEGIFKAIDECRYFILVLSNGALDRCMSEDDWVRHEIEYALSKGKDIIPVCPSGSMRGFPEAMPESFEPLRLIQISRLEMDDLFDKSFDKIVEDRFDEAFKAGRSPLAASDVVTVRSFKKIGIGVIAAILFSAIAVGGFMVHGNAAAERRASEATRLSEAARERAEFERRAADAAKEKAREEALAAQREKMRLEAEAQAKAAAEEELRKAREEKIRLEAEAQAKAGAEEELRKAREEKMRLEAEAKAKEDANAKLLAEMEARIKAEAATRTQSVGNGIANGPVAGSPSGERAELEAMLARCVQFRAKLEPLRAEIDGAAFDKAKRQEEAAGSVQASPATALENSRDAIGEYRALIDDVIRRRIAALDATAEPFAARYWETRIEKLTELLDLDPENRRLLSEIETANAHVNPSLALTATIDGEPAAGAAFFVNGERAPSPFRHVFVPLENGAGFPLVFFDITCEKDGDSYSARKWVQRPGWLGATNMTVELKRDPKPGTVVAVPLGDATSADFVWCPPGSVRVPYLDPDTDEWKDAVKTRDLGFWISRTEIAERTLAPLLDELDESSPIAMARQWNPDLKPKDRSGWLQSDLPALVDAQDLDELEKGLKTAHVRDGYSLRIPDASEWLHAAFSATPVPDEDGLGAQAWFLENSDDQARFPVGRKNGNGIGAFDMFGNVREWASGSAREHLGFAPEATGGAVLSRLGGSCEDDYEGVMDFAAKTAFSQNWKNNSKRAGLRLVVDHMFASPSDFADWMVLKKSLASDETGERTRALALVAEIAKDDAHSLSHRARREFVRNGGDPAAAGIPMEEEVRSEIVSRTDDFEDLEKYATSDPVAYIRENAFRKIRNRNPDDMIVARFVTSFEFDPANGSRTRELLDLARDLKDPDALAMVATNAANPVIRLAAIPKVCGAALKAIALDDKDDRCAFTAIQQMTDRAALSEVRKTAKRKDRRAAARDRLAELSE